MTIQDIGSSLGNFFNGIGTAVHNFTQPAVYASTYRQPTPIAQRTINLSTSQPGAPTPTPTPTPSPYPLFNQQQGALGRNPDISKKPMSPQVQAAIESAAREFNVPAPLMYDIGYSEGGFRPDARNTSPEGQAVGVPTGLFQFTPGTWNQDLANYAKSTNTSFKDFNPQTMPREDPNANARAAAYLISHGQLGRWSASYPNWGRFYNNNELKQYFSQTPEWKGAQ